MKRALIPAFPMRMCWTLTVVALVGCYSSYSVGIDDSANDGGIDTSEPVGGNDTNETPKTDRGTGTPDTHGGNGGIVTPDTVGGNGGIDTPDTVGGNSGTGTPDTVGGNGGIDTPDTVGGSGGIDTPDTDGGDSFIDNPMAAKKEAVQLTESEWTNEDFADCYDNRWFTVDVVIDNIYHIYIDDESGSGLHNADEQLYIYEGEPSDIREFFHLVDVHTGDNRGGFYDEPYDYPASFTGKLYILLVSDNPGYQTFEIRYEVN